MDSSDPSITDVVIIGGGIAGLILGCLLGRAGIKTVLIDQKDLTTLTAHDARAFAIAYGSCEILKNAGIWESVVADASPILDIRTSDQDSSIFLHYAHDLVGNHPMGYMIPEGIVHRAAMLNAQAIPSLQIISPQTVQNVSRSPLHATVTLANGTTLKTQLVVAADGKKSMIREGAQIKTLTHDYDQIAITCTIGHEHHHQHLAQERFLSTGPFAVLPLKDGHHSSLVWTERTALAPLYLNMNDKDCIEQILKRTGSYLGAITSITPRMSFPLVLVHAKSYIATRLALLGDAAHGIHPLAGQGLNLGIRDSAVLSRLIIEQAALGLDIGSQLILKEYAALRKFDSWSLIGITHGLNHLFGLRTPPVTTIRRLGMAAVNAMPFLKARLIRHAMGR